MTDETPSNHDESRSTVLLASTLCWHAQAKLAIALSYHGARLEAVCPPDHPFCFVGTIRRFYPYRVLDTVSSLFAAIASSRPHVVVPCDDGAVWQLHELHRTRPELRPLIERSLGDGSNFQVVGSRKEFMQVADDLRIRIPETTRIAGHTDLAEWFSTHRGPGVLKLDRTSGGKGVRTVSSLAEATQACAALRQPANLVRAWARWFAIRDALALWNLRDRRQPEMILQQYIEGRPANTMFACRDGKLLALLTVEVLCAEDATGAALAVRVIDNDEIRVAAERITARLGLSGFHGLDFILERETGHAYLLELNPRCTQLGHLCVAGNADLAAGFCRGFLGADSNRDGEPILGKTIIFFPQALRLNQFPAYFGSADMDVPWQEPALVRELMRGDWRERTLLGRMFFAIRSPNRIPVAFDPPVE